MNPPALGECRLNGIDLLRRALTLLLIVAIYVAAGTLGLELASVHTHATPVWLPTGIAIGAMLRLGSWIWPAVLAGAYIVNESTSHAPWVSLGIAAGNTLEALVGTALIHRFAGGRNAFDSPIRVFAFALCAGLVAPVVSATIGVGALTLGGLASPGALMPIWLTWLLGNGSGALLVAPLIVLWQETPSWQPWRALEGVLLMAALLVVPGLVFAGVLPSELVFLGLPLLAWSSFRCGRRTTGVAAAVLAAIAIVFTLRGRGPFVHESLNHSLLLLQTYMGVSSLAALAMSAAVAHRRRLTEDVHRLAGSLQDQVASRSEEVATLHERLDGERAQIQEERERGLVERIAREEAERANRQKDEFLAVLSHELRTPLHTMAGWAEILQAPGITEEQRLQAAGALGRGIRTQARLISDMLDLSRITSGKLELSLQRLDVVALVRGVLQLHEPMTRPKRLRLEADLPDRPAFVQADGTRLDQVLGNLLSNAIAFTPEQGVIRVVLRAAPGEVEITVTDSGPGIEPALRPFIFDRFRQGDSTTTRRHGGLGLGLTIARHLVELHGGTIGADNAAPGGARFAIRLPAAAAGHDGVAASRSDPVPLSADVLAGRRILVVDDDEEAREFARFGLRRFAAEVVAVDSGDAAVAALADGSFDLVLCDLAMPGEDGYRVLGRLRALQGAAFVPVVALTAHASVREAARARAAGFDGFVAKPVGLEELIRTVIAVRAPSRSATPDGAG